MGWLDEIIDSKSDEFNASGPKHLLKVDWENSGHRRSVVACLVKGVYVAERDRQKSRRAYEARAPAWWKSFHFKVIETLIDRADSSIFGAVYKFNPPTAATPPKAPRYVIAFRGISLRRATFSRDIKLGARLCARRLHPNSRFQLAWNAVFHYVSDVGHSNVWLGGHSLGSSFATLVGKNMASRGVFLESFLFNPPFPSIPMEIFKIDEKIEQPIRIFHSYITTWLSEAADALVGKPHSEDSFANLSSWVPCLFVNKADVFCSEYVEYFQHRETMEAIGAAKTGQAATQNSVLALMWTLSGKDADPLHLLPSANLNFHGCPSQNLLKMYEAHKLRQWWQPDLQLQYKEYRYTHRNAN